MNICRFYLERTVNSLSNLPIAMIFKIPYACINKLSIKHLISGINVKTTPLKADWILSWVPMYFKCLLKRQQCWLAPLVTILLEATARNEKCQVPRSILSKNTSQRWVVIYCKEGLRRIGGQVQDTYLTKNSISSEHKLPALLSFLSCSRLLPIKVRKLIFITSKLVSEFV